MLMGEGIAMIRRLVGAPLLFVYAAVLLFAGVLLAFWYAPVDASSMGFSQKIFYYHVPIAESALVAFAVSFVAAVLYLRRPDPRWDRLGVAGIRIGLFFSLLVMVTGMIWGRTAWGVWWAWEPRLTTFLIACVLYAAYFVVRAAVDDEQRRATVAAVFAVIAFVDVPITFFATRYLPEGLHPVVFTSSGAGMEGSMLLAFLVSMAGMTFLMAGLIRLEVTLMAARQELADLKDVLEAEEVL
jgi:heme exporter protein C